MGSGKPIRKEEDWSNLWSVDSVADNDD